MNLKNASRKNCIYHNFQCIIKIEDFDVDNILLDEKLYENIQNFVQNFDWCITFAYYVQWSRWVY